MTDSVILTGIGAKDEKIDLNTSNLPAAVLGSADPQKEPKPNVLRVTHSAAQYDVSASNPNALPNLGKALAGSLDRDSFTFVDPESKREIKLGDVLTSVDLSSPNEIVLCHRDTAGRGLLGRVIQSLEYVNEHPVAMVGMKVLGIVADPEKIYEQKVIQLLSELDQEGLFGPPGRSTFNLSEWEVTTRTPWRDVVVRRREPAMDEPQAAEFSATLARAFRAPEM